MREHWNPVFPEWQLAYPWDDANIGQIAVSLGMIEPITNYEFVRNAEAHVIGVNRLFSARRFVKQRRDAERPGLVSEEKLS
jgi:hypothetical protein